MALLIILGVLLVTALVGWVVSAAKNSPAEKDLVKELIRALNEEDWLLGARKGSETDGEGRQIAWYLGRCNKMGGWCFRIGNHGRIGSYMTWEHISEEFLDFKNNPLHINKDTTPTGHTMVSMSSEEIAARDELRH